MAQNCAGLVLTLTSDCCRFDDEKICEFAICESCKTQNEEISQIETKTSANEHAAMGENGNIKAEIRSGNGICNTPNLDNVILDDFERGALDRFSGADIGNCDGFRVLNGDLQVKLTHSGEDGWNGDYVRIAFESGRRRKCVTGNGATIALDDDQSTSLDCSEEEEATLSGCETRHSDSTYVFDDQDPSILSDLEVSCGLGNALKNVRLIRPSSTEIAYSITCCPIECSSPVEERTATTSVRRYENLASLEVDCGSDKVLTSFDLDEGQSSAFNYEFDVNYGYIKTYRMFYRYTCCRPTSHRLSCVERSTNYNEYGNGYIIYLDRHRIECGNGNDDEFLSSFRLRRNSWSGFGGQTYYGSVYYDFKCCKRL